MSSVHTTAPSAAAKAPRARAPQTSTTPPTTTVPSPRGSTAAGSPRRGNRLTGAIRNVGIFLDTAARVVFLGRDGVKL